MGIFSNLMNPRCPDCGEKLIMEEENPEGAVEKSAWESIYSAIFLIRRQRFICMNKECSNYYMKTHHKFLRGLGGGKIRDEHFIDSAMRDHDYSTGPSKKQMQEMKKRRAGILAQQQQEEAEEEQQEGADQGDQGGQEGGEE